jgi:5-methylcytosine-specific restriction endonuclease McrA
MADDHLTRQIRDEGFQKAIERMIDSFDDVSEMAKSVAADIAKQTVERNYSYHVLAQMKDHDSRASFLAEALRGAALEDHSMSYDARSVVGAIWNKKAEFEALCAVASEMLQSMHEKWTISLESHAASERRVAELTERLKEHALNSPEVREAVWAITGGKCFYCEIELVRGEGVNPADQKRLFHVDHLVPKILGGPDHIANYVPSCHSCNSSKHARHFAEFVMSRKAKQEPPLLTVIEGGAVA